MSKEEKITFDEKHKKDLQRIAQLRLMDDVFMSKVFEDHDCAELLLHIILENDELHVLTVKTQQEIKNLQGRSVRLDILMSDNAGKMYDVEVQRSDSGASQKRARYNSSLIDANVTEPGEKYEKLNESYVIFITQNDVLKDDLPIYHIDRVIMETGATFADGSHIIYVNMRNRDETALGYLMRDFMCVDVEAMHYDVLARRVRYFKKDVEGAKKMSGVLDEIRREAAEEAAKEATIISAVDTSRDMGVNEEKIEQYLIEKLHLTKEEAKKYMLKKGA